MARQQQYPLRFHPEERAAWQAAADQAGLPLSVWIRAACNLAANYTAEAAAATDPGEVRCTDFRHTGPFQRLGYMTRCQECGQAVR